MIEIWNVIWQHSPFHYCILGLLIVAMGFEIYDVFKTWKSLDRTDSAIRELERYAKQAGNQSSFQIPYVTKNRKWFQRHLAVCTTAEGFQAKRDGDRFGLLQYPATLACAIPQTRWRFVPGLLIAIGIMGTFYGIQLGLSGLSLNSIGEDSTKLLASSVQLLEGMKTTFSTSLMGMASSCVLTLVLAGLGLLRRWRYQDLRDRLDAVAFLESPEMRLLSRLDTDANADTAKILSETAKHLSGLSSESIGLAVSQGMKPLFQDLQLELQALQKIQANQSPDSLRPLIEAQQEQLIKPILAELRQSAKLTQEASGLLKDLKLELSGISKSLADSIVTIGRFQEETLGQLQDFTGNLPAILMDFRTETKGVMDRVAIEIQTAVQGSIQSLMAQREAFAESAHQTSQTFQGIREDLQGALTTQAEIQQQTLQEFKENLVDMISQQTENMIQVSHEASRLMARSRDSLHETLSNLDVMLQNTRLTVQKELEEFRVQYQASLEEFFNQQNQLLEGTFGKQGRGLAGIVEQLDTSFKEEYDRRLEIYQQLDRSIQSIQTTVEKVSYFSNSIGITSGEELAKIQ